MRSRNLAGRCLALLLLAILGQGCRPEAVEPPQRLFELVDPERTSWRARGGETASPKLRFGWQATLPQPRHSVELEMQEGNDRESRLAMLAPTDSRYRFDLTLPPDAVLSLGLGYVQEERVEGRSLAYLVRLVAGEEPVVVLLDEAVTCSAADLWRDREIDLSAWAGRQVSLLLEVEGADEDTVWGAWAAPEVRRADRRPPGWNVILVSLDTLRGDHLSSYGYERPTSPHMDALAARGFLFETAMSQAPWTRPSHRSMLTGLFPASRAGLVSPKLALALWSEGYRTGAITGGGQVDRRFGFHSGFETYRVEDWIHTPETAAEWLAAGRDHRNFLFLHTFEIHDPYEHTRFVERMPRGRIGSTFATRDWERLENELTEEEKDYVEALYDGGIAYVDERMGELFAALEEAGELERTVIIITSDHGEQFFEHDSWRHGASLYDHQLHVPLIVYLPPGLRKEAGARGPRRIARQVALVDLYPTVFELLGVPLEHEVQGQSLMPYLRGEETSPRRTLAESTSSKKYKRKALRTDRYKFIYSRPRKDDAETPPLHQLFDLRRDPGEHEDLSDKHAAIVDRLLADLEALWRGEQAVDEVVPDDISPELRKQLEALGYVGDQ